MVALLLLLMLTRNGAGGQARSKALRRILFYLGPAFVPAKRKLEKRLQRFSRYAKYRYAMIRAVEVRYGVMYEFEHNDFFEDWITRTPIASDKGLVWKVMDEYLVRGGKWWRKVKKPWEPMELEYICAMTEAWRIIDYETTCEFRAAFEYGNLRLLWSALPRLRRYIQTRVSSVRFYR